MTFDPKLAAQLAEQCERDDKAMTPGPWKTANGKGSAVVRTEDPEHACAIYLNVRTCEVDECVERWQRDATSIAHTRNALPRIAEQLRAACEEVERLRGELMIRTPVQMAELINEIAVVTGERDQALSDLAAAREEIERLKQMVGRVEHWTHVFGAALKPPGADTYGEGMRDAKAQVSLLLRGDAVALRRVVIRGLTEENETLKADLASARAEAERLRALIGPECSICGTLKQPPCRHAMPALTSEKGTGK